MATETMPTETMATDRSFPGSPRTDRCLCIVLAAALAVFAFAKLGFGYRQGIEISRATYYAAAGVEMTAALLLLSRLRIAGALLCAAFFAVAIGYSAWGDVRSCGCLGPVRLSSGAYRMIAATLGLLATLVIHRRLGQRRPT